MVTPVLCRLSFGTLGTLTLAWTLMYVMTAEAVDPVLLSERDMDPGVVASQAAKFSKKLKEVPQGPSEDDEALYRRRQMEAETNCGAIDTTYPTPSVLRCESCKSVVRLIHFLITKLHLHVVDILDSGPQDGNGAMSSNVCSRLAAAAELRQYTNGQRFWDISRGLVREKDRQLVVGMTSANKFTERITRTAALRLLESKAVRHSNGMHFYVDDDIYAPLPLYGRLEYQMGVWEKKNIGTLPFESDESSGDFHQEEKTFAFYNREVLPLTQKEGEALYCMSTTLKTYCHDLVGRQEDRIERCVEKYQKVERENKKLNPSGSEPPQGQRDRAEGELFTCLMATTCETRQGDCDPTVMNATRRKEYDRFARAMAAGGAVGSNVNPHGIPFLGAFENPFTVVDNPYWVNEPTRSSPTTGSEEREVANDNGDGEL